MFAKFNITNKEIFPISVFIKRKARFENEPSLHGKKKKHYRTQKQKPKPTKKWVVSETNRFSTEPSLDLSVICSCFMSRVYDVHFITFMNC